jgi:hypothetical protein
MRRQLLVRFGRARRWHGPVVRPVTSAGPRYEDAFAGWVASAILLAGGVRCVVGQEWVWGGVFSLCGLVLGMAAHRRHSANVRGLRESRGCCPECGYDVRATPERCPECGTTTPESIRLRFRWRGNDRGKV